MKRVWLLGSCLVVLAIFSISVGAKDFSWTLLLQGNLEMRQLFFESRLPRLLSVLLAGSSMSVAGLLMQTMTQNEFAAPSTIGTVEASQFGLMVSLFLFQSPSMFQKMVLAFVAAFVLTGVFVALQQRLQLQEKWMVPLVGMMVSGVISAVTQMVAYEWNLVQSFSSWMQGSFSMVQTHQYEWLFLSIVILVVAIVLAYHYAIMSLGEAMSANLGVPYRLLEVVTLVLVSLTASVTVMTIGALPFIGVIVPNMVRLRVGGHVQRLVPDTALVGAGLVLVCDMVSRIVIAPYEVSVSLILGCVGAVIFIGQVVSLSLKKGRAVL